MSQTATTPFNGKVRGGGGGVDEQALSQQTDNLSPASQFLLWWKCAPPARNHFVATRAFKRLCVALLKLLFLLPLLAAAEPLADGVMTPQRRFARNQSGPMTWKVSPPGNDIALVLAYAAIDGDTVEFEPGLYRACGLAVARNVRLVSSNGANSTIIDCEGQSTPHFNITSMTPGGAFIEGFKLINNDQGCVAVEPGSTLELSAILFANCRSAQIGGAIHSRGKLTLRNVSIEGCFADSNGGAISAQDGTLNVVGLDVSDCHAYNGGGLYLLNTAATLTDVAISGCSAHPDGLGGAIYVQGGDLNSGGLIVSGCEAYRGGGLYLSNTVTTLTDVAISGCAVTGFGGAVLALGGELSAVRLDVRDCYAIYGGGLFLLSSATTFTNVAISGCSTPQSNGLGGAIYANGGGLITEALKVSGCEANQGGGLYLQNTATTLTDVAISDCSTQPDGLGGAIYALGTSGVLNAEGLIVSNCEAYQGGGLFLSNTVTTLTDVAISGCSAQPNGLGGAILTEGGELSAVGLDVRDCYAIYGGGLFLFSSATTFTNVAISGCSTPQSNGRGGAIYAQNGVVNAVGLAVSDCQAYEGGGLLLSSIASTLTDVTLSGCSVSGYGGAIYAFGGSVLNAVGLDVSACQANNGGGICLLATTAALSDVNISGCSATQSGGAIFARGTKGVLNAEGLNVIGCEAYDGGGLHLFNTAATMSDVVFSGCSTRSNGLGGAIYAQDGGLSAVGLDVCDCHPPHGGGLFLALTASILTDVTVANCSLEPNGVGGAVVASGGELNVVRLAVRDCQADLQGGGLVLSDTTATMSDVVISGCSTRSNGLGGAIYAQGGGLIAEALEVSGCEAKQGGGLYLENTATTLTDVAISGCSAYEGGGLFLSNTATTLTAVTIRNCSAANAGGGVIMLDAASVVIQTLDIQGCSSIFGGGIYARDSSLQVPGTLSVSSCDAGLAGGGIVHTKGTAMGVSGKLNVTSCTSFDLGGGVFLDESSSLTTSGNAARVIFLNNVATSGGAIFADFAWIDLAVEREAMQEGERSVGGGKGSFFEMNTAKEFGGSIMCSYMILCRVYGAVFDGSAAGVEGGAIKTDSSEAGSDNSEGGAYIENAVFAASIENAVFRNNAAEQGGALEAYNTAITFIDCIFLDNHAIDAGGAVKTGFHPQLFLRTYWRGNTAHVGGGLYITLPGTYALIEHSTFISNSARHGGALATGSTGVGLYVNLHNSRFELNEAIVSGGALHIEMARVYITGLVALRNTASVGGGIAAAGDNTAVYIVDSALSDNSAQRSAGALHVSANALVMLRASRVVGNSALGQVNCRPDTCGGGAIATMDLCVLYLDEVVVAGNTALGYHGGGLQSGGESQVHMKNTVFSNNTAGLNGGGIATAQEANLHLCEGVSVTQNAALGQGGGLFVAGAAASLDAGLSVTENQASSGGGGMFVLTPIQFGDPHSPFVATMPKTYLLHYSLESSSACCTQLQCVVNSKVTDKYSDPGHCFGRTLIPLSIDFEPVGDGPLHSFLSGNSAQGPGGAMHLSGGAAQLLLMSNHLLTISNNSALDGGGLALSNGATLEVEQEQCSKECSRSMRGNGVCNGACLKRSCNYDDGDCSSLFDFRTANASLPCHRGSRIDQIRGDTCALWYETGINPPKEVPPFYSIEEGDTTHTYSNSLPCQDECLNAACDWGNDKCSHNFPLLSECPLLDLAAYRSYAMLQDDIPIYVTGGGAEGRGRCLHACQEPTTERPEGPWCRVVDDGGEIRTQTWSNFPVENMGEAWGYCSAKPRLPGSGFNYNEEWMRNKSDLPLLDILAEFPACGRAALQFSDNHATGNGGALLLAGCDSAASSGELCFMAGMTRFAGSDLVVFRGNSADGAGGAVYTGCHEMGNACDNMLARQLGMSPLESSSRVLFFDNRAGAYGPDMATAPNTLVLPHSAGAYTPGLSRLNFSF